MDYHESLFAKFVVGNFEEVGRVKCFLWFHDWQIKKTWEHYYRYERETEHKPEEGARGWQCRKCGRRKIKKIGGLWNNSCAIGPWEEAVDWMCEEVIH